MKNPYPPHWDGKPYVVFNPTAKITERIRKHFKQAAPNDVINRIDKVITSVDQLPTVRDEWAMICPKCGNDEQIDVLASCYVRLTPDGTDADASHDGEHAWSTASAAKCCACGHTGIVREFMQDEQSLPDDQGPVPYPEGGN